MNRPDFLSTKGAKTVSEHAVDILKRENPGAIVNDQDDLVQRGLLSLAGTVRSNCRAEPVNDNDRHQLPLFFETRGAVRETKLTKDIRPVDVFVPGAESEKTEATEARGRESPAQQLLGLLAEMRDAGRESSTVGEYLESKRS